MSVFNIERIKFDEKSDIEKVTKYLHKLNENLEYMFNNITPEDNYSSNALIRHIQEGDKVAEIAISVDGITQSVADANKNISQIKTTVKDIELNMIHKGNIISSINLSTEGVAISGDKINLEGTVTANKHFVIDREGCMSCKNATISGTLNSAKIIGGSIEGKVEFKCGQFWIRNPDNQDDIRYFEMGIGNFEVRYDDNRRCCVLENLEPDVIGKNLQIYNDGYVMCKDVNCKDIVCRDIKFDNGKFNEWLEGWSLLKMLKDLYDKHAILKQRLDNL